MKSPSHKSSTRIRQVKEDTPTLHYSGLHNAGISPMAPTLNPFSLAKFRIIPLLSRVVLVASKTFKSKRSQLAPQRPGFPVSPSSEKGLQRTFGASTAAKPQSISQSSPQSARPPLSGTASHPSGQPWHIACKRGDRHVALMSSGCVGHSEVTNPVQVQF